MKSRLGYSNHFLTEAKRLKLSLLEKVIIFSLLAMCLISAVTSLTGRDVGNSEQLKMAKQQAQEELMALRMHHPD